jgi:predicted HD phosphohydrolase
MRDEVVWTVEHHASFQMYYYAHHYGWNQHEREKYRASPYYQSCVDFCERWDQSSFDPAYSTESLDFFVPMVREVFARKAHDPAVQQRGVVRGLPPLAAAAE